MKCQDGSNNVKVYHLTGTKNVPDWLEDKRRRKAKKQGDDLILQDFEMPDVSTCMELTKDGHYLMVAGVYKPCIKCYDLSELSVKFERGMDAEVIALKFISEDFSKVIFLEDERYVEIHGQGGKIFRMRIPRFGRDLVYNPFLAETYISASGNEIYRLNLFQGRFLNSLDAKTSAVNKLHFSHTHGLLTCGTDDGHIQIWDPRSRQCAGQLNCGQHVIQHFADCGLELRSEHDLRVTALEYYGPFTMAVGNHTGLILMYDIRNNKPTFIRDHKVWSPIKALHFHNSGNVFSMAPNVVKIWEQNTGKPVTSFEGDSEFNDMVVVPGTGLSFFASEDRKMKAYFIPSLGPAPSWCSHLDAMTEEMADDDIVSASAQFDDYTFVTVEDLCQLGLKDLIGSGMLRAVMHGYYINTAAYNRAKMLANPVKPEKVAKMKLQHKLAQENTVRLKADKAPKLISNLENIKEKLKVRNKSADALERASLLFTDVAFAEWSEEMEGHSSKEIKGKNAVRLRRHLVEQMRDEEDFRQAHASVVNNSDHEESSSDVDSVVDFLLDDNSSSSDEGKPIKKSVKWKRVK